MENREKRRARQRKYAKRYRETHKEQGLVRAPFYATPEEIEELKRLLEEMRSDQ